MIYNGEYKKGIKTREIFGDTIVVRFQNNTPIKDYNNIYEWSTQNFYEKLWTL